MCTTISTLNMSREEWLQLRKSGIGGSDAGAICGLNPYASPMSVYRDKTCEDLSDLDSETMRQGRDLEDYVARRFMEATGLKVRRSNMMYRSEEHPFMISDVDRLIVGEDAGLECKTASAYNADKWKGGEGFIDIKGNVQMLKNGKHRQTCNRYYLLDRSEWQLPQ